MCFLLKWGVIVQEKYHILLADDHLLNQKITRGLLESLGHVVDAVSSGEDAVKQAVAFEKYDLVILDINMPGMTGIEAAHLIAHHTAIPVAGLTAFLDASIEAQALAAGMRTVIAKPVGQKQLAELVDATVDTTAGRMRTSSGAELPWPEANIIDTSYFLNDKGTALHPERYAYAQRVITEITHQYPNIAAFLGESTENLVHSLAGAAGVAGMPQITLLLKAIEDSLRAGQQPHDLVDSLADCICKTHDNLATCKEHHDLENTPPTTIA
jgi:CheY-like chemotaxis protein